ncbi:ankyrin repeat, PH and SEC7 domain containing protein secG-like [Haliotis rufescens]|uniref:ankyrin repeat, PH and SEC7 domain containing protein secG-like n=1 Tax=Haliotis rufescens TaxID=6454 RepID=UPI00201F9083|nr:ankyrin repeat, PH and SEC7 domain containing protein secG-like [Haliotis rufescens]
MYYFEDDLYDAIATGNVASLKGYMSRGLSVNHAFRNTNAVGRLGMTLLDAAVSLNQKDVIRHLVSRGSDVNMKYVVDIDEFCYKLREYRKRDKLKMMSMYPCIVKGDVDMVKLLIQGGFDVNIQDDRGCTALWHAVDLSNYDMAKAIAMADGCDVNLADVTMLRPLHVAALHGNVRIASLLVRYGAIIDAVQLRGSSPLILAVKSACYDTVRLLLLNGADPNRIGYNGHTPISTAFQVCTDRRIVDMLIEAGAYCYYNLIIKCQREKLPLLKHHPEVVGVLKELASSPRSLKIQTCLVIRRTLLASKCHLHLMRKVAKLPLPKIMQEFLLLSYL